MQPSTCPLCRKAFLPDRIKKLHIDRPPNYADNDDSTRVSELLQRIALVSGENAAEEQVMGVISEVQQWLATRDDRTHVVVSNRCGCVFRLQLTFRAVQASTSGGRSTSSILRNAQRSCIGSRIHPEAKSGVLEASSPQR